MGQRFVHIAGRQGSLADLFNDQLDEFANEYLVFDDQDDSHTLVLSQRPVPTTAYCVETRSPRMTCSRQQNSSKREKFRFKFISHDPRPYRARIRFEKIAVCSTLVPNSHQDCFRRLIPTRAINPTHLNSQPG